MSKTWFITGTSSGFGWLMTESLLARGDRVAATLRSSRRPACRRLRRRPMLKANNRQLVAMCLGAMIAMSAPAVASGKNLVAGTWLMVSAKAGPDGENRNLFGSNPSGLLIFTEDLHFSDVLVNPEVPSFASSDRAMGTATENKAVVAGDLALYGTYTVDDQGRFATEHVIASTFPNWSGLRRDTSRITETVDGDTMVERLKDPGGPQIVIVWKRAR